jgi:hypothetical protein
LVTKHSEIEPYLDLVKDTIVAPEFVNEALAAPDSKAFYSATGVVPHRPFQGCRVAVIVRYTHLPGSIATAYLPIRVSGTIGKRLYPEN